MLTILFVLTLASDVIVLYENSAFSILALSTKKRYSSFLKKVFVFQKTCFKIKVLKTFKTFSDCHIKTCRSLPQTAISKFTCTTFRRTYALSVGFKMKPLRENVFLLRTNSNIAVKLPERSNHSFLLSI